MDKIVVAKELREELCRLFGVVDDTIGKALNFKTDTELSRKIRAVALQKGGKSTKADMTTIFESNGDMVQTWGDNYRLVVEKNTGNVKIYVKGSLEKEVKNMSVADLMKEQKRIGLLVASRQ